MSVKFVETVSACGNVWRAHYDGMMLEICEDRLQIYDPDILEGGTEVFSIADDGGLSCSGGENVTDHWTENDWGNVIAGVMAVKG